MTLPSSSWSGVKPTVSGRDLGLDVLNAVAKITIVVIHVGRLPVPVTDVRHPAGLAAARTAAATAGATVGSKTLGTM